MVDYYAYGGTVQFVNVKIYMFGVTALTGYVVGYMSSFPALLFFAYLWHSFAFSWLNAGYLTRQVNISEQTVEFVREEVYNSRKRENISKRVTQPKMATLPVADAIRCIRTYFNETVKDTHGRYLSWQHCYNAFILNRSNVDENTFDYLALHLAFYLASWGMYRGFSFLLQKDYKVHIPIVKIIMEKQYNPLVGITAEELIKNKNLDLLDEVSTSVLAY